MTRRSITGYVARAVGSIALLIGVILSATAGAFALTLAGSGTASAQTCFTQGNGDLDGVSDINGGVLGNDWGQYQYTVPATGVQDVQVTLDGYMGDGWYALDSSGNAEYTSGGDGSQLTVQIPVSPGEQLAVGTLPGGSGGASYVQGYYDEGLNGPYLGEPNPGGDGGNAEFVESTGSCPQLLAVAAGGGGGGGITNGGNGGNADLGSGAGNGGDGGSNAAVDGSGGGAGTSTSGGGGGSGGYNHWSICANGSDAPGGGFASAGDGADGAADDIVGVDVECAGGAGGGGGGAGYYGGGGGGSGWDDDPSGGGGGGSTWVEPGGSMLSDLDIGCGPNGDFRGDFLCQCPENSPSAGQDVCNPAGGGNGSYWAEVDDQSTGIVPQYETTVGVTASPYLVSVGQPVTITGNVNEATSTTGNGPAVQEGTVTFYDGTTELGQSAVSNGVATLQVSNFTAGTHQLTATFSGGPVNTNASGFAQIMADDLPGSTGNPYPVTVVGDSTPQILTQPTAVTSLPGDTVSFTAAAYGNPLPTTQWQVSTDGGSTWSAISGATNSQTVTNYSTPLDDETYSSYSFTATSQDQNDQYRAMFTNGSGSTATSAARLSFSEADQLEVSPASETLTLGVTTPQQITATASYPDNEQRDVSSLVTWSVSPPSDQSAVTVAAGSCGGICVTAVGAPASQPVDVTATLTYPDGDTVSSTAAQFTVASSSPSSITVTPSDPTVAAGGQEQFTATAHYANGATVNVTDSANWQSDEEPVVHSDGDGLFTVSSEAGTGSTTISAAETNGTYGQTSLTTTAGTPESISITDGLGGHPLGLGQTTCVSATATYADDTQGPVTVQWSSNAPSIASVSTPSATPAADCPAGDEVVTGTATQDGEAATIYAVYGNNQVEAQDTIPVTIDQPNSITVSPGTTTLSRGATEDFTATGHYANGYTANVTLDEFTDWSISGASIGGISDGQLTVFDSAGGESATVDATLGSATGTASVSVLVGNPTSISITMPEQSIGVGQTEQLTAAANFESGPPADVTDSVTWSSNFPTLASISPTGLVTGLQPFSESQGVVFTASISYPGLDLQTDTSTDPAMQVTDTDPLSITVCPTPTNPTNPPVCPTPANPVPQLNPNATQAFTATGHYPLGLTVDLTPVADWNSNSTDFIFDQNPSTFLSENAGAQATVDVTASLGGVTGSTSVTLLGALSVTGPTLDSTDSGPGYASAPFTASGGSGSYTWSVQGNSDFSLSATTGPSVTVVGNPTLTDAGEVDLQIQAEDSNDHANVTTYDLQVDVSASGQTITLGTLPASAAMGTSVPLTATGGASGEPITYSVSLGSGSFCHVTGSTLYLTDGPATCLLFANQAGTTYYEAAQQVYADISILGTQTVGFTTTPASDVPIGAGYTATVNDSGSGGGNVSVSIGSSTTNDACSITGGTSSYGSATADVSFDHAGTCVIDGNEAGSSSYVAATTVSQTVTVEQTSQQFTASPAPPSSATVGGSYSPTLTPGASGTPVVMSVDATTNAACSITSGVVSFDHTGSCVLDIDENEPGTSDYAPDDEQVTIPVGPASQTITITSPSTSYVGTGETPAATGGASGNAITYALGGGTTNGACTYAGGTLSFVAAGTCELDANQGGDADYTAAPQAVLDISVVQLQLAVTSVPFSTTASSSDTTPFTVTAETASGTPWSVPGGLTVSVASSSTGGSFAATSGGAGVSSLSIAPGSSSVTGYYGDTVAGSPVLSASTTGTPETFLSGQQTEAVGAASAAVMRYSAEPSDQVVGGGQYPAVAVTIVDQFGNGVAGEVVSLQPSSGTLSGGTAVTNAAGIASFGSLSFPAKGVGLTLSASTPGLSPVGSTSFNVDAPLAVTSIYPTSGISNGGTTVTVHGSGFDGATSVDFGGIAASQVTVLSDTELTAVSPQNPEDGTAQTVNVNVLNDVESSPSVTGDEFSYDAIVPSALTLTQPSAWSATGQSVTLKASVAGTAGSTLARTGSVEFINNGSVLATVPVNNDVATLTTTALPAGTDNLTAVYSGDGNYASSFASAIHNVQAGAVVSLGPVPSAWTGEIVTYYANVTGSPEVYSVATGTVTFYNGAHALGTVTLDDTGLAALTIPVTTGVMQVTARYNGSQQYAGSTSAAETTVVYGPVAVTLTGPTEPLYGQSWSGFVKVAPTAGGPAPSGSVTLYDGRGILGTASLVNGVATYTTTTLPVGFNGVYAQYQGNVEYDPASSNEVMVYVRDPMTVTATTSEATANPGDTVTLTANLTPQLAEGVSAPVPSGTVTFTDGSVTLGTAAALGNGTSLLRVPASSLAEGNNFIVASYSGDGWYAPAKSVAIPLKLLLPTQSAITSVTPNPGAIGSAVVVTATVSGPAGVVPSGGTVRLYSDSAAVASETLPASGQASFSVVLPVGMHSLTVAYAAPSPYESSTSSAILEPVYATPSITLRSSANPAAPGTSVTFTAHASVTGPAVSFGGSMTFYVNGSSIGTEQVSASGSASVTTSFGAVGSENVSVLYSGGGAYLNAGSPPYTETVIGHTYVALTSSMPVDTNGASPVLTATVSGTPSSLGTPTGSVQFVEGGTVIAISGLNSKGAATVSLPPELLEPGTGSITADYLGDRNFAAGSSKAVAETVTLPTETGVTTSVSGASVTLTANVDGYPATWPTLSPTGTVSFTIGSVQLGSAQLSSSGAAAITIDSSALPPGVDAITGTYSGDGAYTGSTSGPAYVQGVGSTTTSLTASGGGSVDVGATVTFTAQVNAVVAGGPEPTGQVSFDYGKVHLGDASVNSAGTATLTVVLSNYGSGTVAVTATYLGDLNYDPSPASTAVDVTVVAALPAPTVDVSTSSFPATYGDTLQITATVGGIPTPTGTVMFTDQDGDDLGSAALSTSGVAQIETSSLPVGPDTITATYSGDSNYAPNTGTAPEIVGYSTQTVDTPPDSITSGVAATFSVTVSSAGGTPTGRVEFIVNKTTVGTATLVDGVGTVQLTLTGSGSESVDAVYQPADPDFLSSFEVISVTVS